MAIRLTKTKIGLLAGAAAILALSGAGVALASSDDDASEKPIPGSALDKAKGAALAETGGGKVTDTEVGDDESLYEVEVTLDNGEQVDVQLDKNFDLVGSETDSEEDDS